VLIGDDEVIAAFAAENAGAPVTFNESRGGSGLGLSVARYILEAHGGRLHGAPGGLKTGARIQFTG
jgi:signal transduction histidine kinase